MEDSEQKKLKELLKEMRTEGGTKDTTGGNDEVKLNWMYKGPLDLIDREEYLLGKSIDKSFEVLNAGNYEAALGRTEQSNVPKRLLEKTDSTEQVDIAKKILEDPLYAIKQKEMEARKKLLNNPVKLKQIKQMLLERSKRTKKQKKKKLKKKKLSSQELDFLILRLLKKFSDKEKRKALNQITHSDSSNESSSSKDDEDCKKKSYKKLKRRKSSSEDSKSSSNSEESEKNKKRKKESERKKKKDVDSDSSVNDWKSSSKKKLESSKLKHRHSLRAKSSSSLSSSSSSSSSTSDSDSFSHSEEEKKRKKIYERESFKKSMTSKSKNDRRSPHERRAKDRHSSERKTKEMDKHRSARRDSFSDRKLKKNYGLMMPDGSKPDTKKQSSPPKKYIKPVETKTKYEVPHRAKPLSEKERAKKLKEMMQDAKLRKEDSEKTLASHRKKESKEEDSKTYDEDFMRRQMSLLTSQGTMADRIKSNVNNIQRSKSSMDTNFMRK